MTKSSFCKYRVVDLFSGCGGLSLGFSLAGTNIIAALDIWETAINTLKLNHPNTRTYVGDILKLQPSKICPNGKADIVIGGPPCQGVSIAGKRLIDDERNTLYKGYLNFVDKIRPAAFLMENVPHLAAMDNGSLLKNIISDFQKIGYSVSWAILKASDYGVPQDRRRLFIIGFRGRSFFNFTKLKKDLKNKITSKDAISDLPEFDIVPEMGYPTKPLSEYQKIMRRNSKGIYNHITTKHTEKTINIINMVPDGGNYKDLPIHLHNTRKVNIAWTRLNSKKPSFTIDTGHRHHFHYKYNRVPTVREAARIQSFPDNYIFTGNKADQEKQVGNAVPPLLAKEIAEELIKQLRDSNV
jgi:DNA (cytosine-5)-methyltransferase 1